MPTQEIDVQIYCSQCNVQLVGQFISNEILDVEPCKNCLEKQYDNGYGEGYRAAINENVKR